jgi:hypothetical protein
MFMYDCSGGEGVFLSVRRGGFRVGERFAEREVMSSGVHGE